MQQPSFNQPSTSGSTRSEFSAEESSNSPFTITEQTLQKRLAQENRGRYITQFYIAVTVSCCTLSFGTVLGWSSPVSQEFMHYAAVYNFTNDTYAIMTCMAPLGSTCGVVPWTFFMNKLGPKRTMFIQSPLLTVVWLSLIPMRKLSYYIVARFLCGFLAIAYLICGECLLIDSVHPLNLRHMIAFFRTSTLLGVIVVYMLAHYLNSKWLTIALGVIPLLNAILLKFAKESPVFLVSINELKAENALSWYRGHDNIYVEFRNLKNDAQIRKTEATASKYMIYSKVIVKAISIDAGLCFFQIFSGYYGFIFYLAVLSTNFVGYFSPYNDEVIFGFVVYICHLAGALVHFGVSFGVRKPMILSCFLVAVVHTFHAIYLFLIQYKLVWPVKQLSIIFLYLYVIGYEVGLGTYPKIILWDYTPIQVYRRAQTIIYTVQWFFVFLLTRYFMPLIVTLSFGSVFTMFAIVGWIGVIFCYFVIVETKNKSLVQIQIEIGGNPVGNRGAYCRRNVQIK